VQRDENKNAKPWVRSILINVLLSLLPLGLAGQATAPLEFEVASIKPIVEATPRPTTHFNITRGTFHADYAALRQIIGAAYNIQRVRVIGGPDELDSILYTITAKAGDGDATSDQIREMIRTLLSDRFRLVVHHDTRQLPVYTLLLSRSGSKLQEAKEPIGEPSVTPGRGQFGTQLVLGTCHLRA
jgi:uncharacterized protein (TIGR03435 family)